MTHLFSDLGAFQHDALSFFETRAAQSQQALIKLRLGPWPVYLVNDPQLVKPLMKSGEDQLDKGRLARVLRGLVGESFVAQSGHAQSARRAVMHQFMAKGVAQKLVPEFAALIRQQAVLLAAESNFDARGAMAPLAIRLVTTLLFGKDVLSRADENAIIEAVHLTEDVLTKSIFRLLPPMPWVKLKEQRALARGKAILQTVVEKVRTKANSESLLHALEDLHLSDTVLRDEIMMLLIAGYHSTGNAATWLLYLLGTQPDLCNDIAREAASLVGESGDIDAADLPRAKKSLVFVKEVLRLYPSFPWTSRELKQSMVVSGQKLKRGTTLIFAIWQLQRDKRYWNDPHDFDISRDYAHPAYLPFGLGPRACIGAGIALLELQLICLEFASAFAIHVRSEVPAPRPHASITIIPPSIRISLTPRGMQAATQNMTHRQNEYV